MANERRVSSFDKGGKGRRMGGRRNWWGEGEIGVGLVDK